ncbi:DNA-directed RNA polymerase, subunit H, RpoH/RPB5 [Thermoplasmatales archaeon BRNA1]|nr:DNA-directed RNA polymerase, subunit H, RpoH/RPB5 [Thermoplasmatales archaeon BRNA1]
MAADTNSFNILEHDLVPEHHLLSEEETQEVLSRLGISREQLPKIKTTDAAIMILSKIRKEPITEGSVIKVIRKSDTAGEFEAYRLVTEG